MHSIRKAASRASGKSGFFSGKSKQTVERADLEEAPEPTATADISVRRHRGFPWARNETLPALVKGGLDPVACCAELQFSRTTHSPAFRSHAAWLAHAGLSPSGLPRGYEKRYRVTPTATRSTEHPPASSATCGRTKTCVDCCDGCGNRSSRIES